MLYLFDSTLFVVVLKKIKKKTENITKVYINIFHNLDAYEINEYGMLCIISSLFVAWKIISHDSSLKMKIWPYSA